MNTRTTTGLVTTGWSVIFSLFTAFAAYASTSPNCSDVLAGNTTAVSQKMMVLLGEEIRKVRSDLEKAAQEVSRLQGTFEVAFVSLIDGYCQ